MERSLRGLREAAEEEVMNRDLEMRLICLADDLSNPEAKDKGSMRLSSWTMNPRKATGYSKRWKWKWGNERDGLKGNARWIIM